MAKRKDPFEPTIEESTMASGLHQQGGYPALDRLIEEKMSSLDKPSIFVSIPEGVSVNIEELSKDINSMSKKIGGSVHVHVRFTITHEK